MKKIILFYLLTFSGYCYSQSTPTFSLQSIDKEVRILTGADTVSDIFRYDLAFALNIPDTSAVSLFKCEFYKTVVRDGIASDSSISVMDIYVRNIGTSAYNDVYQQKYFMEGHKLYFTMKALDIVPGRFIKIRAYRLETLVQTQTYNLDF